MRKGGFEGYIGNIYRKNKKVVFYEAVSEKLDQLYTEFSSGENGLSTEQAVKNCEKFGRNVITEGKKKSIPMIF